MATGRSAALAEPAGTVVVAAVVAVAAVGTVAVQRRIDWLSFGSCSVFGRLKWR